MKLIDFFKSKLNGKNDISKNEVELSVLSDIPKNEVEPLAISDIPSYKRVEYLINYFIRCIENDKNNTIVLNHINNIFAYQENLKNFFNEGKIWEYGAYNFKRGSIENDNGFTIKVLSIAIELLSSENIYKVYYIKSQQGLANLKEVFRRMYILKKYNQEGKIIPNNLDKIEEDMELELNQFIDKIFNIPKHTGKYSIKDFLNEYKNLLEQNITIEEYDSSLIKQVYDHEKHCSYLGNCYPFSTLSEESLFDLEFEDDTGKKRLNYEEMYNGEKFEFIMNYILALYQIELMPTYVGCQLSDPLTSAKYSVFSSFGHQCIKKKKVIEGKIDDLSIYEEGYRKNNYPFLGSGAEPQAVYFLCAVSDEKEYKLCSFSCDPELDDKYTSSGERISGLAGGSCVGDYGINLTKEQIVRIFEIIKNFIINKDGYLNLANGYDSDAFCCCITMMEIYNDAYKDSEYHEFISEKIKELKNLIEFADINYLAKLKKPEEIKFESEEQRAYYNLYNDCMAYTCSKAYDPLVCPDYIYDGDTDRFVAKESNEIKKILKEKREAFHLTQESAVEQYNSVTKNIDKLLNLDGEKIEKYLDMLYGLANPYEEEDKQKHY